MEEIIIDEQIVQQAAAKGMDNFLQVFVDAIKEAIGGELTSETLPMLNANQVTLLAYNIVQREVMDGGFIQLIHNGYGAFIFQNPFDKALKAWQLIDLSKLIKKCGKLYRKYGAEIEQDCTDEAFMALFEKYPAFDDFDDAFVENEEQWTSAIAYYIDEHIDQFANIKKV